MFDVLGTLSMSRLANHSFNFFELHTLTGQIAIWLMFIHAIWATYVVRKGSEKLRTNFHRYSILVWVIWLIPYFGGMIMGMTHNSL